MGLLDGHVAVVTGGASGIGRAIALGYAREGARTVVLDVDADGAHRTVEAVTAAGGAAESFRLDVRQHDACCKIAAEVEQKTGPVSILVNNAGINRRNAFAADAEA